MTFESHILTRGIKRILEAIQKRDLDEVKERIGTECVWGPAHKLCARDQAGNAYILYNWAGQYTTGSTEWMYLTRLFISWCNWSREAGSESMFEKDSDICTVSEMRDLYSKTVELVAKKTKRGVKTLFESDVAEYARKELIKAAEC